eukprot:GEMP01076515.1.p2 GENE.GEMP01076515.1~~GEMP01076515.1.p2  ORF type:complete len:139 (+),score=38.41 GEMP01076515.1:236-652(+)
MGTGMSCGTQLCTNVKSTDNENSPSQQHVIVKDDASDLDDKPTGGATAMRSRDSDASNGLSKKDSTVEMSPLQKRLAARKEAGATNYLAVADDSPKNVRGSAATSVGGGDGFVLGGHGESHDESIEFLQAESMVSIGP